MMKQSKEKKEKKNRIINNKYFVNIGLKNKIYYLLTKFLPSKVIIQMIKKKYNLKK